MSDEAETAEPSEPPKKSRWKGPLVRMGIFYFVLCSCLYAFQYRLQYMPTRMSMEDAKEKAAESGLLAWPDDATEYLGFLAEPDSSAVAGTVVIFHGNAGDAIDRDFMVPLFRLKGFRVILLEYQGYGARSGKVGESSIVTDATTTLDRITLEFEEPLYILGESLGAGVASAVLAKTKANVDGVALFTPWDTLPDLAAQRFWFVPARYLVVDRFDSISNLKTVQAPIAVYIAEDDEVIPSERSQRLYDALTQRKQLYTLPGCSHNTWPEKFGAAEVDGLIEFWRNIR